ncbi:ATPase [Falsiroseomonas bella]|uniref:ATPase n=1 Tax=Falsiroseomonas bella TaxID=2184016 RepID=A0A317FH46_9PROT|nr:SRPBCC family protein [Falsiroseomonas bella]PWS37269.1 ATPase [Falsiroseomonas bella]
MNDIAALDAHGVLTEPGTLTFQRILPGPMERVWAYLTESELRRKWLAAGEMTLKAAAPFELVWRNDDLSAPGQRPADFPAEQRMQSRILALDPPRRLVIAWGETGEVSFTLEPRGERVLLTLVHRGAPDRATLLNVGAGWHMHLDILVAIAEGWTPASFWEGWSRLRAEYDRRMPG